MIVIMIVMMIIFYLFQLIGIVIAFYLCANVQDYDEDDDYDDEVEV